MFFFNSYFTSSLNKKELIDDLPKKINCLPHKFLYLPDVKVLSKASAKVLSTFQGFSLSLNGLSTIDKSTAEALSTFKGKLYTLEK